MQLTRAEMAETQIIVTTPEKWDVVTRKPTGEGEIANVNQFGLTLIFLTISIVAIEIAHHRRGSSPQRRARGCYRDNRGTHLASSQ